MCIRYYIKTSLIFSCFSDTLGLLISNVFQFSVPQQISALPFLAWPFCGFFGGSPFGATPARLLSGILSTWPSDLNLPLVHKETSSMLQYLTWCMRRKYLVSNIVIFCLVPKNIKWYNTSHKSSSVLVSLLNFGPFISFCLLALSLAVLPISSMN